MVAKVFNVNGACRPSRHYMVDLTSRLEEIKAMVDAGEYFTINRARQYGKTTILRALAEYLKKEYIVAGMDFQRMSAAKFENENRFSVAFADDFVRRIKLGGQISEEVLKPLETALCENSEKIELYELFGYLSGICAKADKPIVLLIDEVDTATNNQVFIDFLAQLRAGYLDRTEMATFQSVILAGVYDVRSLKRKIRSNEEHKLNSPWNIAARFRVDMSFSKDEIAGMLKQYEADYRTGMDVRKISGLIYDYTSGYPVLVSSICKFIDEEIRGTAQFPNRVDAWTAEGVLAAVKILLEENNPLFDSMMNKFERYPKLKCLVSDLLFQGKGIAYVPDDAEVRDALMFGFVKVADSKVQIANRIFETRLYNKFLLDYDAQNKDIYTEGARQKSQFIASGHLNMKRILEKFVETFDYLYGGNDAAFLEEEGRRYFMLFLKPIINGTGNCYVEAETRNRERMDLVIDYCGEQFVVELKIWRGNAYNERGEEQLSAYLDYFKLCKGYMLSFNFNQKKEIGVREIVIGDKTIVEAVV